ncbi:MAG: hypothetical protein K6G69_08720 [Lachnospiraceae bacterium]|nr:hypothetical protein [Lachnospiraceae bacterium]
MEKLTLEKAKEINATMVTEEHLLLHAANVSAAMEAMAEHFGEDKEHWAAVGWLHDYDYEKYPEEHLLHTEEPLRELGVPEEDIRAIMAHGYSICTDTEPLTDMEKSLFAVDELTGIVQAAARMRPAGITDMEVKSFMKKWKDKRFAAKCNRELILKGCEMLGMDIRDVAEIVIRGMKAHAEELQLAGISGMYRLNLGNAGFRSERTAYNAGEKVTVYFDMIASDTDYHFYTDDVELQRVYGNSNGYEFTFEMPEHDVTISVESRNTMTCL